MARSPIETLVDVCVTPTRYGVLLEKAKTFLLSRGYTASELDKECRGLIRLMAEFADEVGEL